MEYNCHSFHVTLIMTDREQKRSDPAVWLSQRVVMTTSFVTCPVAVVATALRQQKWGNPKCPKSSGGSDKQFFEVQFDLQRRAQLSETSLFTCVAIHGSETFTASRKQKKKIH
jgi:hypothetical protein